MLKYFLVVFICLVCFCASTRQPPAELLEPSRNDPAQESSGAATDASGNVHRPFGVQLSSRQTDLSSLGERASGISDADLNSTVFISKDPKSAATDSVTLYIDRNNVGKIHNVWAYKILVPSGEHYVILNVGDQYYTDHLTFRAEGRKAVSISFPFPADDDKFLRSVSLSAIERPRDILGERFSAMENSPISLSYGNGNLLMNDRIFKGLTASFSEGKRFVNLQDDIKEMSKWLKPADPRIFKPGF